MLFVRERKKKVNFQVQIETLGQVKKMNALVRKRECVCV